MVDLQKRIDELSRPELKAVRDLAQGNDVTMKHIESLKQKHLVHVHEIKRGVEIRLSPLGVTVYNFLKKK